MKKKKISFPSALTVLFIVLIFAAILTAVVPAGLYSKLTYNADHDVFEITTPEGEVTENGSYPEIPGRAGCYRKLK